LACRREKFIKKKGKKKDLTQKGKREGESANQKKKFLAAEGKDFYFHNRSRQSKEEQGD